MSSHTSSSRRHRSRSRSRSPSRRRQRSDSPHQSGHRHRHHRHRHHEHRRRRGSKKGAPTPLPLLPVTLPLNATPISTRDYRDLELIFTSYLDIQKNLAFDELDEREARGRFKSFVKHYNRGELARGWYERTIKLQRHGPPPAKRLKQDDDDGKLPNDSGSSSDDDGDNDKFGPVLPGQAPRNEVSGPAVPSTDDLEIQRTDEADLMRYERLELQYQREQDRKAQKEELEELVPRAEPGSRERKLEKKKELNDKMRSFRERSPVDEVDDSTLMGGGNESLAQRKAAMERKKNDRELRREQNLKAKMAEREERFKGIRAKEERTMAMLKSLAASRFGGGGGA